MQQRLRSATAGFEEPLEPGSINLGLEWRGSKWAPDELAEVLLHEARHGDQAYRQLDSLRKGETILGPSTIYEASGGAGGLAEGGNVGRGMQDYWMNPLEVDARAAEHGVRGGWADPELQHGSANLNSLRRMGHLIEDPATRELFDEAVEEGVVGELFPATAIGQALNEPEWGQISELSPLVDKIRDLSVDAGRLTPDLDPDFLLREGGEFASPALMDNVFKARNKQRSAVEDAWMNVRRYLGI